jgi:hypothetical protein
VSKVFACVYVAGSIGSLVDFASGFSPLVEEVDSDTVVLDIAGCELLFGNPGVIAKRIAQGALEAGYGANVAIAGNPDAAIHAARVAARYDGYSDWRRGELSKQVTSERALFKTCRRR